MEANRMAQVIKQAINHNQRTIRGQIWVNISKPIERSGEPVFWVDQLSRYVGFDEMDYDISVQRWRIKE